MTDSGRVVVGDAAPVYGVWQWDTGREVLRRLYVTEEEARGYANRISRPGAEASIDEHVLHGLDQ